MSRVDRETFLPSNAIILTQFIIVAINISEHYQKKLRVINIINQQCMQIIHIFNENEDKIKFVSRIICYFTFNIENVISMNTCLMVSNFFNSLLLFFIGKISFIYRYSVQNVSNGTNYVLSKSFIYR